MNTDTTTNQQTDASTVTQPEPLILGEPVAKNQDRRMSDEWDASKVPPSRFQKRKGSIYATPSSRDGHVDRNYQDKYHAKIAEMNTRKKSVSS
ncbi:Putative C6 zinc finger domain containing protein [[Torrubiella] hemipterigena]|uniref:Putative C6 zinc finger domain containing protein n=1 Tax=[Torrubiella] hemipterigena TaxID=1531966 RepID=A0A0A1TH73_9HYPO|nr:Putative C6 zinc finger domain containing protein [[Torrubiella] hemipterigena]